MRIAHINNIANVAWRLAEAQRRLGHDAVVFIADDNPFGFPYDVKMLGARGPILWNAAMLRRLPEFLSFDVLHVHGGIWISQIFYPMFKAIFPTKLVAIHYHGSETRWRKGLHHIGTADLRFHSTADLGQWLPKSRWIPNPIDVPELPPPPDNPRTVFAHVPSVRAQKGTDRIVELFRRVFGPVEVTAEGNITKLRGREAELWLGEQMRHEDVLRLLRSSDVLLDQFHEYRIYGVIAIEAMAYGMPVFGTPDLSAYPGCPIIRLDTDEIASTLKDVARDPALRRDLGTRSRDYVRRIHESGIVARQIMRMYYEAIRRPPLTAQQAGVFWARRGHTYAAEIESPKLRRRYEAQSTELLTILEQLDGRSVVEVGCGYGRIGRGLRGQGKMWTGLDLSRGQLARAREEPTLRPRLVQATAEQLPLADASADLVLAVEVLLHIPPDRIGRVMQEMWRVSRGHIVHLDWFEDYLVGFGTGWNWVHDYHNLWRSLGGEPHAVRVKSTKLQCLFVVEKSRAIRERPPQGIAGSRPPSEKEVTPSN